MSLVPLLSNISLYSNTQFSSLLYKNNYVPHIQPIRTFSSLKPGGRGSGRRGEGGDGVCGLKKLGVKEFTYKLIFVACSVQHTDARTGGSVSGSGLAMCCMGVTGDSAASSSGKALEAITMSCPVLPCPIVF